MKLILGMVVGLIPGEFVLDGDPAHSPHWAEISGMRLTSRTLLMCR